MKTFLKKLCIVLGFIELMALLCGCVGSLFGGNETSNGGEASVSRAAAGVVLDEQGNPVAAASVNFSRGIPHPVDFTLNTDSTGFFGFTVPFAGAGTLTASKAGFLSNSTPAPLSSAGGNFFVIILTRGSNPPLAGNRRPRVNTVTVTPSQLDTGGTVTISANITDDDSANIIALAVVRGERIAATPLTRAGDTFSGSVRVPVNSTNQPQTYLVYVAATDADNGSNETDQSRPATFTVNPPLTPPGTPSFSRVNRAERLERQQHSTLSPAKTLLQRRKGGQGRPPLHSGRGEGEDK